MARYWFWTGTVLCLVILMQTAAAREHDVGGKRRWAPPPASEKDRYNRWAEQNRFLVNDIIVFTYDPSVDSVMEVSKEDYDSCTTSNPKNSSKDGNTHFMFKEHGAHYFISGNATNCQKGEKVVIVVLAPRNIRSSHPAPAPTVASPPPSSVASPPAPSTTASPQPSSVALSPAPSTAASPPPIATSPGVSPSVVPVASPSVTPVASPTVASVPSTAVVPAMGPGHSAPFLSSPTPAPLASEGGVVPSPSAGNGIRPRLASAAIAVLALALSGGF